jgi:hypothetical protein
MRKDCAMRDDMRNEFVTPFWQRAYDSLPAQVRGQYLTQMKAAEQWELTLQAVIELWSRAKNAILKLFQAPSRAH